PKLPLTMIVASESIALGSTDRAGEIVSRRAPGAGIYISHPMAAAASTPPLAYDHVVTILLDDIVVTNAGDR
ncbi:hypothetical protein ACLKMY_39640, partial [Paraburkholderia mimosarum]